MLNSGLIKETATATTPDLGNYSGLINLIAQISNMFVCKITQSKPCLLVDSKSSPHILYKPSYSLL